jgi:hypothetical protein
MVLTQTLKMVKVLLPSEKRLFEKPEAELAGNEVPRGRPFGGGTGYHINGLSLPLVLEWCNFCGEIPRIFLLTLGGYGIPIER